MIAIHPEPGALSAAAKSLDNEQSIVMVNLLKFREAADYDDGTECSGTDAYKTYSAHTAPLLRGVGGEVVYSASAQAMVIAPPEERWDFVLLVRYPNFSAFMTMIKSEAYRAIVHHRTAALADSRLFATQ